MHIQYTLISTIVFFSTIAISLYAMYGNQSFYERFLLSPWRIVNERKWYLMITSGFLHADLMHLMFNMLTFYFFAFRLESIIGSVNFFIIYFGCLIFSNITTISKNKDNYGYRALGASGAIAGILFSYILYDPTSRIGILFIPIGIPAPIFAVLYIAYCYYAAKKAQDYINHDAHLWGAVTGLILTALLDPDSIKNFFEMVF